MGEKTYAINEIFYSLQGEGARAGEPSIFVRFRGCNMQCDIEEGPLSPGGFACDTEFASGSLKTLNQILDFCNEIQQNCHWLVLTGGEPGLQVDRQFIDFFHGQGFKLAIETNGTIDLPIGIDHITVSPKVAEHALKQLSATEVKYVRAYGQSIPVPKCVSDYKYISPAWSAHGLEPKNLQWCIDLCLANPEWRLSLQTHKLMKVR